MPYLSTKQDRTHVFPLEGRALALLRGMARVSTGAGYLFPGHREGKPGLQNLQKHWDAIREKAGLQATVDPKTGKKRQVRIHDLRHTFAANLKQQGVDLQAVGQLLGRTQMQTTMRYAHISNKTLTDALEKVSRARKTRKRKGQRRE
jgi:site-specific recombinase XerD